ncbi:chromosome transmission fidelity protein 8 [Gymnopilus junonius]|uniref:Chromosome transmission fidelity protein 8 n=1 Tax=Gymnopilus junonius TaxID=109634 RepID=A0A9P5TPA7_GYMJU|nr:chromosome transmission fidelity protein 8 [Gymnopilus junonius]
MLIPITLTSSSSNPKLPPGLVKISHDEYLLIELQGSLEVELNDPSERDSQLVGKLKIDEATNKPTLVIGHHLLEGKIAALPKPYAILVRTGPARNTAARQTSLSEDIDGDAMDLDTDTHNSAGPELSGNGEEGSGTGWSIAAIVNKKIIFAKRPMPVIGKK